MLTGEVPEYQPRGHAEVLRQKGAAAGRVAPRHEIGPEADGADMGTAAKIECEPCQMCEPRRMARKYLLPNLSFISFLIG